MVVMLLSKSYLSPSFSSTQHVLFCGLLIKGCTYPINADFEIMKLLRAWSKSTFTLEVLDLTSKWPKCYWKLVLGISLIPVYLCWIFNNTSAYVLWINFTLSFLTSSWCVMDEINTWWTKWDTDWICSKDDSEACCASSERSASLNGIQGMWVQVFASPCFCSRNCSFDAFCMSLGNTCILIIPLWLWYPYGSHVYCILVRAVRICVEGVWSEKCSYSTSDSINYQIDMQQSQVWDEKCSCNTKTK